MSGKRLRDAHLHGLRPWLGENQVRPRRPHDSCSPGLHEFKWLGAKRKTEKVTLDLDIPGGSKAPVSRRALTEGICCWRTRRGAVAGSAQRRGSFECQLIAESLRRICRTWVTTLSSLARWPEAVAVVSLGPGRDSDLDIEGDC